MKYLGGKKRFSSAIVDTMERNNSFKFGKYVDAFVGSASVLAKVDPSVSRTGYDNNPYVVALLSETARGWRGPVQVDEEMYRSIKERPEDFPEPLVAFVAVGCSWGAKWFGGYARGAGRNYAAEASRSLERLAPMIQGANFYCSDYQRIPYQDKPSCWYLDPPYANTTQGYLADSFDSDVFWRWAESLRGHVYVSEYSAPVGWDTIKIFETKSQIGNDTTANARTDKLFFRDNS